jgi:hypothetical protein
MRTKAELEIEQKKILDQIQFARECRLPTIVIEQFKDDLAEIDVEMALLKLDEKPEKKEEYPLKDLPLPVLLEKLQEMLKII